MALEQLHAMPLTTIIQNLLFQLVQRSVLVNHELLNTCRSTAFISPYALSPVTAQKFDPFLLLFKIPSS